MLIKYSLFFNLKSASVLDPGDMSARVLRYREVMELLSVYDNRYDDVYIYILHIYIYIRMNGVGVSRNTESNSEFIIQYPQSEHEYLIKIISFSIEIYSYFDIHI